jgi:hypothetical protein
MWRIIGSRRRRLARWRIGHAIQVHDRRPTLDDVRIRRRRTSTIEDYAVDDQYSTMTSNADRLFRACR